MRKYMKFNHQDRTLEATPYLYGPGTSVSLINEIRDPRENSREPTASEMASFIHAYSQRGDVAYHLSTASFMGFTGILFVPGDQTIHFIDYPTFNTNGSVNVKDLSNRISESRSTLEFTRFYPGPVLNEHIREHPFILAWVGGQEGAEKLAYLASTNPRATSRSASWTLPPFAQRYPHGIAYICIPDVANLKKPLATVATLGFGMSDLGLLVCATNDGSIQKNYSFGILAEREKRAA